MKKIVTPQKEVLPYPEVTETSAPVLWEAEAIESLQSLERYTVLKAIDEGKRLVKRVMEVAAVDAGKGESVMKFHVQNAIAFVIDELEKSRHSKSDKAS